MPDTTPIYTASGDWSGQLVATAVHAGHDLRPEVAEQIESMGAQFVYLEFEPTQDGAATGGYAAPSSPEFREKQLAKFRELAPEIDIVIELIGGYTLAKELVLKAIDNGKHVVTANKLGNGGDLARAQAIAEAGAVGSACYGDAATVGAGLPVLRTIRQLVAGGDRIHAIEGVLSGSLAWLFGRYDDGRPFSDLVREARALGFTEPDPRIDLSGDDVRRKLLILARAAGVACVE